MVRVNPLPRTRWGGCASPVVSCPTDQLLASDGKYKVIVINNLVKASMNRYMVYIGVSRVSAAVLCEIDGYDKIAIYLRLAQ
jgi:hypothetical protein